ncbi:type I restriction enzyme S subunit [Comamonas odontotermitis]|uniref:Type I restriction enzyme S subunit n=1 Tax=Comamonas odontotermitis TaxID=379895 RepID=A0ABR6RB08_9BURK|nr:restriction endonuclease subunit S [Comamonas odontotermitis]MBB6576334.1 type I restriction enzyme S subunit [Comamonas odontotermitis]
MSVANEQIPALPNGWEWVPIGETGEYINGFAFKPSHRDSSGLPIVRIQNLTDESKALNTTNIEVPANYKIDTGDMLMSWSATLDVFVWRRGPALVNQHIFKVVPDERVIRKELLFYWLKQAIQQLQKTEHLHGSTMMHINRGPFMAHKVPLPPVAEQVRIISKLGEVLPEVDAGFAELKAAQKKLAQYRQSLLKSAVDGALTAEWRAEHSPDESGAQLLERILQERRARWEAKQLAKFDEQGKMPLKDWQNKYPVPTQPDATNLPDLPVGWVWASLDQVSEIQGGIQKQPSRAPLENKYPFLRVANVARGKLKLDDVHEIELFSGELERLALVAGDVLIVEGNGSLTEIGRCAVWDGSIPNAVHQNHLIRVRPIGVVSRFVETWLNSLGGIEKLTKLAATTSGLYTLSVGKISKIPVPIAPRSEQEEAMRVLIESLSTLDSQEQSLELALKQATAQRQNILRAAFAGQLVPQDPNDESAGVLLGRIRAERSERGKQPKARKTKQQKEIATVVSKLIDVLAEAGDWVSAQEAFRRCGVGDGAQTERVEELYAELRKLDHDGKLAVEAVNDEDGRKLYDKLKLLVG